MPLPSELRADLKSRVADLANVAPHRWGGMLVAGLFLKDFVPEGAVDGVPYVVVPYVDRMDLAYSAADVAVCRSGANTVCELTAVGLPGLYVPLPIGNGEQRLNAAGVVEAGGGALTEDAAVTPTWVREQVVPLLTDSERVAAMSVAAASVGERDGDELLADLVGRAWAEGRAAGTA